jgi:hypothetical protein
MQSRKQHLRATEALSTYKSGRGVLPGAALLLLLLRGGVVKGRSLLPQPRSLLPLPSAVRNLDRQ